MDHQALMQEMEIEDNLGRKVRWEILAQSEIRYVNHCVITWSNNCPRTPKI